MDSLLNIEIPGMVHRIIIFILTLLIAAIISYTLLSAGNYYLTSQLERPYLAEHQLWKPSGYYGHGLGILGTVLIFGLLLYSLRKRWGFLRRVGSLRVWLNYHIFMGITGPLLIILHTTFKFNGLVSVSFWSMIAVWLSGFIGKYIYVQIPRARDGAELSSRQMESRMKSQLTKIVENYQVDSSSIQALIEKETGNLRNRIAFFTLFTLPFENIWLRLNLGKVIRRSGLIKGKIQKTDFKQFRKLLLQYILLMRRVGSLKLFQGIFHYWHVIHKPFAYIMIIILIIHILIAIYMGFTWIF